MPEVLDRASREILRPPDTRLTPHGNDGAVVTIMRPLIISGVPAIGIPRLYFFALYTRIFVARI